MFVLVAILAMVMFAPLFSQVWACEGGECDGSSYVDGTSMVEGIRHHGNDAVGGFSYGQATGSFKVWGDDGCESLADGQANADALLKGKDFARPNSAMSKSSSFVFSNAKQIEGNHSELSVSGLSQESNWAEVKKDDYNFVTGGNFSEAGYSGTNSGPHLVGGAITSGKTWVNINEMSSQGVTKNNALAFIGGVGDPFVDGQGYLQGANYVQSPNYIATAEAQGTANYSASGTHSAMGELKITESTKIQPGENSLSLSSKVKSAASARGR